MSPSALTARSAPTRVGYFPVAFAVVAIAVAHWLVPDKAAVFRGVLSHLYYVPVFLGAVRGGIRGGSAVALLAGTTILAENVLSNRKPTPGDLYGEAIDLLVLGTVAGFLLDRQRTYAERLSGQAAALDRLYRELQESVEQVRRSERLSAVGQLAAGLAHELRHPVASLTGAVGLLGSSTLAEPRRAECLDIIKRECHRMERFLADLLDFAKPRPPEIDLVNIEQILDRVAALTTHAARATRVEIRKSVEAGLPVVACDPKQIEQVVLNLAINAVQAMPKGGTVTLAARHSPEDRGVHIDVVDCGPGIPEDQAGRLFEPFFTTKKHGTGLGLSVARRIMDEHRGEIRYFRNADQGMTFTVTLKSKLESAKRTGDG